jgi:hypothetical protein
MLSLRRACPKPLIIAVLATAIVLLTGCSVLRIGYGQAPELAYWWLDAYVDFDDVQSHQVRASLARWFAWHRRTQLGDYADALAAAQSDMLADTTPERVCAWWDWARSRAVTAAAQAVPSGADLIASLTPSQWQHIERRHAKTNVEFRDAYLSSEPRKRLEASVKRTVDRAESLYGRLDDAQLRVERRFGDRTADAELWFAERLRRQTELMQMLRRAKSEPLTPDGTAAALRVWIEHLGRSPRDDYRRYADRLTQYNCAFAARLHNSTTSAQRQVAAQKLKGWETDLRALAADAD